MAESSFVPVLQVACFLLAIWIVSGIARALKGSQLVGELLVGVILGPQVLDLVPHPEAFQLLGQIGVVLMVAEAGLQFDVWGASKIGTRALGIAILAAVGPIGFGSLVVYLLGWTYFPAAVAAGVGICPTSVGMASKLLLEAQILRTELGRLLVCVAFLTDVVALTCVAMFERVTTTHSGIQHVLLPLLYTVLFLVVGALLSMFVIPKALQYLLAYLPDKRFSKGRTLRHDVLLLCCIGLSLLFAYVGSLFASLLLGAFMAGMAFYSATETLEAWTRQIKRFRQWFVKIFFAATIGFAIPVGSMMTGLAFAKGLAVFAAAMAGKLIGGLLSPAGTDKLSVGLSLSGRGEFSYAVAHQLSLSVGGEDPLIPPDCYAVVMWGMVLTTFLVPFVFRYRLSKIHPPAPHGEDRRGSRLSEPSGSRVSDTPLDGAGAPTIAIAKPLEVPNLIAGEDAYWDSPALPVAPDPSSAECVPELVLTVTSVDPEEESANNQPQ